MEAGHQHTDAPHGRWPTGPKIDGISVLKELKQDATLRHIPVILVTARSRHPRHRQWSRGWRR